MLWVNQFVRGLAMIDVTSDDSLSLAEASKVLPGGRNGSKPHISTLIRWIMDGVSLPGGRRVKLEAVRFGGKWITSRAALNEFAAASTPNLDAPSIVPRTPTQRQKAIERAEKNLEKYGI